MLITFKTSIHCTAVSNFFRGFVSQCIGVMLVQRLLFCQAVGNGCLQTVMLYFYQPVNLKEISFTYFSQFFMSTLSPQFLVFIEPLQRLVHPLPWNKKILKKKPKSYKFYPFYQITFMGGRSVSDMTGGDNEDEEMAGGRHQPPPHLDWKKLGRKASVAFRRTPNVDFMYVQPCNDTIWFWIILTSLSVEIGIHCYKFKRLTQCLISFSNT